MASATTVKLDLHQKPVYAVPGVAQDSADKTSKLLQQDFEDHHIFFNDKGFHNHIVHGLLSLYATGANPEQLQKHYVENATYQRPPVKKGPTELQAFQDPAKFRERLGDGRYYLDYVGYFQQDFKSKGWQQTFIDTFLKGDEHADDMLVRLYGGLLHPIIHLGFGVEFEQPLIMAEGFAEACVHDSGLKPYYEGAEKAAKQNLSKGKSLLDIVTEGVANPTIKNAAHASDDNKIRGGVMVRAKQEIINLAASYQVDDDKIEERLAEMVNFNAYMMAASQRPPHRVKFDFFVMHCHNCGIFFHRFLSDSWLSNAQKARMLEWKVRTDLLIYFAQGAPSLPVSEITSHKPREESGWERIFTRCNAMPEDDGHASKCLRALKAGEELCAQYPNSGKIEGDMWLKMGHMAIDAVEDDVGPKWVFGCGFEDAWSEVGHRPTASL